VADLTFEVSRIEDMDSTARVALSGAIDASTVITFQSELDKLKKEGIRRFLLDMAGIRYVNSTGLGSLVKLADGLENEGGMIALMQIHPKVKVVFDMLGLNAFFKIFKSDGEALDFFRNSGDGADVMAPEPIEEVAPVAEEIPIPEPVQAEELPPVSPISAPTETAGVPVDADLPQTLYASPLLTDCAECGLNLRIGGPGNFRCPRCFTVLAASNEQQVEFLQRRKDIPLQITLTGEESFVEALGCCVETLARMKGFGEAEAGSIKDAVSAACGNITRTAYDGNKRMSFHVLVEAVPNEILLRFADHGKSLDPDSADFQSIREAVTEISHVPHPKGGNILRILKKL
jgi:anti-anti-sigma factor